MSHDQNVCLKFRPRRVWLVSYNTNFNMVACCRSRKRLLFRQNIERFSLVRRKVLGFVFLRDTIGLKNLRHFFIQYEVKPKPIVIRSHKFSRALHSYLYLLRVLFVHWSVCVLCDWLNANFGFGLTTLN